MPCCVSPAAKTSCSLIVSTSRATGESGCAGVCIFAVTLTSLITGPLDMTSLLTHSVVVNVEPTCAVPNEAGSLRQGDEMNPSFARDDGSASAASDSDLKPDPLVVAFESRLCVEKVGLDSRSTLRDTECGVLFEASSEAREAAMSVHASFAGSRSRSHRLGPQEPSLVRASVAFVAWWPLGRKEESAVLLLMHCPSGCWSCDEPLSTSLVAPTFPADPLPYTGWLVA